jgi:hypothetical protein
LGGLCQSHVRLQPNETENFANPILANAFRYTLSPQPFLHLLFDRQPRRERRSGILEDHLGMAVDGKLNLAVVNPEKSRNRAQERRLPATAFSHQRHTLTLPHIEINSAQGMEVLTGTKA